MIVELNKLLRLKAGYCQDASPISPTQHEKSDTDNSHAFQYWQSELAARGEGTKQKYQKYFREFLSFVRKNPDELIAQRQQNFLNPDRKIHRPT